MNPLEIIIGQIPEAIYFALFMIFTKQLKNHRILLTSLMILEYVLLFNLIPYSIWIHVSFFALTYIILKILYKERSQIIDVFTLAIASGILMIISFVLYFLVWALIGDYFTYIILDRIVIFTLLFVYRNKLYKLQNIYKHLWNRNDKIPKRMKSTTFRALNTVIFNIMFFAINIGILYLYIK